MGSFNKIGFMSNLPIVWGDKTTLMFILDVGKERKKRMSNFGEDYMINYSKGTVNSTDFFKPIFLPIHGDYDDYGCVDNIVETPVVKYIENFFGLSISNIIKQIDNNSVGRGDKTTSPENSEVFDMMSYSLELTEVYDTVSDITDPNESYRGRVSNADVIRSFSRGEVMFSGKHNDISERGMGFRLSMLKSVIEKLPNEDKYKKELELLESDNVTEMLGMEDISEDIFMKFISFHESLESMNGKYFPSNYGNQDQDYVKHYELLSKYLNIVTKKINESIYENGSDFEDYDRLKSKIREEKIDIIFDPSYEE